MSSWDRICNACATPPYFTSENYRRPLSGVLAKDSILHSKMRFNITIPIAQPTKRTYRNPRRQSPPGVLSTEQYNYCWDRERHTNLGEDSKSMILDLVPPAPLTMPLHSPAYYTQAQ